MSKRFLSLLLALTLLFLMIPAMNVSATEGPTIDTSWYNTETDCFILSDVADLEGLAAIVNGTANGVKPDTFYGKTIKLANDFKDTTALTTPIGIYTDLNNYHPFSGVFDGNGKNVILNINSTGNVGMFGMFNLGTIKNIYVSGKIRSEGNIQSSVGGIAGCALFSSIINCASLVDISASGISDAEVNIGGIVGNPSGAESTVYIQNCYASGTITASGTNVYKGAISGILGNDVYLKKCYYLFGMAANGIGKSTLSDSYTWYENDCVALPASQMHGIALQAAEPDWADLGDYGKISMVDALNKNIGSSSEYLNWGIMKSGTTPVFTLPYTVRLSDGVASAMEFSSDPGDISFPDGISYDETTNTYTFNNVCLAHNGGTVINFYGENIIVVLKGNNQIGSMADTTKHVDTNDMRYSDRGIQIFPNSETPSNITFTGDGNLTVYDESEGIISTGDLIFDQNFTGTITVNDHGATRPFLCCLTSTEGNITIKNGTFYLNNTKSNGMYAQNKNINITGGTINVKGGENAVYAFSELNISDTMEITGANETYSADTVKSLTNLSGTEYVTIKEKKPSESRTNTTDTYTVELNNHKSEETEENPDTGAKPIVGAIVAVASVAVLSVALTLKK